MYKKIKLISLSSSVIMALAVTACSASNGSSVKSSGNGDTPLINSSRQIKISQMSTMPVNSSSGAKYYVGVYNDTNKILDLRMISTTNAQEAKDNLSGVVTSLYNGAGCAKLQPSQSCTIAITPTINKTEAGGGFLLNLSFATVNGEIYKASQVLQYGNLASTNGIAVANNNMRVVSTTNSKSYIAVPYLREDNALNKPTSSITPLAENDICDGKYCTHFYTYRGGDFTSKISFANTNQVQKNNSLNKYSSLKSNDSTGFMINSTSNEVANVITDGYNTTLNAAGSSVAVVLQNTGLAAATINSIVPSSGNIVVTNSCAGSSIPVDGICSFNLSTSSMTNGSGSVTITYNNGQATETVVLNVIYLAKEAAPGLAISTNSSDLTGTIYGETKEMMVTVRNTSTDNTVLNNLKIGSDASSNSSFMVTTGVTNPCALDGTTSLSKGAECNLKVSYTPQNAGEGSNFNFAATAQYTESSGNSVNLLTHTLIPYSSVARNAHLSISDFDFGVIRADGHAESTHVFTVLNDGQATAGGINVASLATPLTILNDSCSGQSISQNNTCTVTVKFSAQTQQIQNGMQQLAISYNLRSGSTLGSTTTFANINYAATPAALVEEAIITPPVPGNEPIGGLTQDVNPTTSATTYRFYPTLGTTGKLKLTFTYKNSGTEAAENFVVAANDLPIGFEVNTTSSTCKISAPGSTLMANGGTCNLVVEYMNDTYLATFGVLNANLVKPGYSYKDTSTGINTMSAKVNGDLVNALGWGTVASSASAPGRAIIIQFTLNTSNVPATIASNGVTITLPKLLANGFTGNNSCTINNFTNGATCTITVSAEAWVPAGSYSYEYYAVPTSGASVSLPFRGVASFNIQ